MFVGGEFYYDERWQVEQQQIPTENMIFLNGGKACLIVISAWLQDHGIKKILLPSYLCPTIVNTLERCQITCEYYLVNPDFSIDIEDLARKVEKHNAVYFINYFGFFHSRVLRNYLAYLRQKGIIVIEDNAQTGFCDCITGDFVFNSMRKLVSYDGGYLITHQDVEPYVKQYSGEVNRRLPVIREYRQKLGDYLFGSSDDRGALMRLYNLAEDYNEMDMVVEGDAEERRAIEHLDWKGMSRARRTNYSYLLEQVHGISGIEPIFPSLPDDAVPLGLPVYVSGVPRDRLLDALGESGIGLTIHWDGIVRDPRLSQNPIAVDIAERILTLVCDQRTSIKQMDYMVEVLREKMGLK